MATLYINVYMLYLPGEAVKEVVTDVTAARVAKQSGVEKLIVNTGKM